MTPLLPLWKRPLLGAWYYGTLPCRQVRNARASRAGRAPAMVLFYHRIADTQPNAWTTPTALFVRQIDWLARHFDLVSLAETQRRVASGHNGRPSVAITFDDGYADNCRVALPLLVERKIPVTYFVCTDHVLEGRPFPHDVARGQPLTPNTLEELREMVAAGIEIGAHTRTHADIGQIEDHDRLVDELVTARDELEEAVDQSIRYFAFPYGQHVHLSAEGFDLARRSGFDGVLSAYGGYNRPGDDPFHLQRIHGDPDMLRLKNWLTVDPRKEARIVRYEAAAGQRQPREAIPA